VIDAALEIGEASRDVDGHLDRLLNSCIEVDGRRGSGSRPISTRFAMPLNSLEELFDEVREAFQ